MNFRGFEICCPSCRGDLRNLGSTFDCVACKRSYPFVGEIPDLRVFPDPYIAPEADREKGLKLAGHFPEFDFEGLVRYYYSISPAVPQHHAQQYTRGLMAAVDRAKAFCHDWDTVDTLLDLGCGTAPLLVAAAPRFKKLIGVDISFRWLTVGRKRLQQAGLDIPLICACAEALPFPGAAFSRVASESTVETLDNQEKAMRECHRVMRPGATIFLSTPNRFSLGPDPHLGTWMGGWLPDRWVAAIAVRQNAIPPKRRLLSPASLSRLLRVSGFGEARITVPDISDAQRAQLSGVLTAAVDAYRLARRVPVASAALLWIGPLLHAEAHKPAG